MYQISNDEMMSAFQSGAICRSDLVKFGLRRVICDGNFHAIDDACQMIFDAARETWPDVLHRLPAMIVNGSKELNAWKDVPGFVEWCHDNPGWPDRIRRAIHRPDFPEMMEIMASDIREYCKVRRSN